MFRETVRRFELWLHLSPREFQIVLLVLTLLMCASMLFVWTNIRTVRQAYEYQVLKRENRNLIKAQSLLKLERESLRSLSRVQGLAKKEIGMVFPDPGQVITVFIK